MHKVINLKMLFINNIYLQKVALYPLTHIYADVINNLGLCTCQHFLSFC